MQEPQLTINDLNEDLRTKLLQLEKAFHTCKLKNDPVNKFFHSSNIMNLLNYVDKHTKVNSTSNQTPLGRQTRQFVIEFMCKAFDISRETLLATLNRVQIQYINNIIQSQLGILKQGIDEEMPRQLAKYKLVFDEYLRNKSAEASQITSDAEKKKFAPRNLLNY